MKLEHLDKAGIEKFLKVVDKCEQDVRLIIENQMDINLKSKLSQYVVLVGLFSQAEIPEIEIKCQCKEDVFRLVDFLVEDGGTYDR